MATTMAHMQPPVYPQMVPANPQQAKGLLNPGQTIRLEHYTVTVERYLSQGGFAHVYLVRTPMPLNNTTQHVLKRIAVADDTMLREVRKEVDVMKLLRGHPNIVQLYDSASYSLGNGTHEVYILMEFCMGGGIIDMMNRRLRERLAEHEILQIFVDVCEGVAWMHNFSPPLLHRDLKVENILQATQTSFKLCDFGSTSPVASKVPSSAAEIKDLEADLNRHTTLQYRAPEMVDPYLRRPVDEKSDVWALGVLLYKLCYYTTPFEEHGPLAILNVSYKIPPYPVYSSQMNTLIRSMLREHGTQRPSAFELLDTVHRMRGTKPLHRYVPKTKPLAVPNPLYRPTDQIPSHITSSLLSPPITTPPVLKEDVEILQPMRRGRPSVVPVQPLKPIKSGPVRVHTQPQPKSPIRAEAPHFDAFSGTTSAEKAGADTWGIPSISRPATKDTAFDGFADSFDVLPPVLFSPSLPPRRLSSTSPIGAGLERKTEQTIEKPRRSPAIDAFDDLGVSFGPKSFVSTSSNSSNSLLSVPSTGPGVRSPSAPYLTPAQNSTGPDYFHSSNTRRLSPSGDKIRVVSSSPASEKSVEERFPPVESLSSLDSNSLAPVPTASSPVSSKAPSTLTTSQTVHNPLTPITAARPQFHRTSSGLPRVAGDHLTGGFRNPALSSGVRGLSVADSPVPGGARSQQVTGTAMREEQIERPQWENHISVKETKKVETESPRSKPYMSSKPVGRRQSSEVINHRASTLLSPTESTRRKEVASNQRHIAPAMAPKDWLTGDAEDDTPSQSIQNPPVFKLETKRSSTFLPNRGSEAEDASTSPSRNRNLPSSMSSSAYISSRPARENKPFDDGKGENPRGSATSPTDSSGEEGPEEAVASTRPRVIKPINTRRVEEKESDENKRIKSPTHVKRGSVYDLVDIGEKPQNSRNDGRTHPTRAKNGSLLINLDVDDGTAPLSPKTAGSPVRSRIAPDYSRRQSSIYDPSDFKTPALSPIERRASSTTDSAFVPRKSTSSFRPNPTPTSPLSPTNVERTRPRSMFISPSAASSALLSPPSADSEGDPSGTRSRRSIRRGSISDIVSKFEALESLTSTPTGKAPRPAPLTLPITTPTARFTKTPSPTNLVSPSRRTPASSRSPEVSSTSKQDLPRTGPRALPGLIQKSTFELSSSPTRTTNGTGATSPSRTAKSQRPARALTTDSSSNAPAPCRQKTLEPPSVVDSPRSSPSRVIKPTRSFTVDNQPSSATAPSSSNDSVSSPSPERPYQGVGKLIDQWQKKTEEAEKERGRQVVGSGPRRKNVGVR